MVSMRRRLFEVAAYKLLVQECYVRVRSLEDNGQSEIERLQWPLLHHREFKEVNDVNDEGSVGCY